MMEERSPKASAAVDLDRLLLTRGITQEADGYVIGCSFSRDGSFAAFATGDGDVHLAACPADGARSWRRLVVHDGAVLSLAADIAPSGFLTGGDDNLLCRIDGISGKAAPLVKARRWVEHVASFAYPGGKEPEPRGLIVASVGKQVELRDNDGRLLKTFDHETTVSGVTFDAKGKRIATSHYNGASLWFTNSTAAGPQRLLWRGSHIGVAWHPGGEVLVTAMQESELHGWRLSDGHNMRMSGYPQKTQSLSFSRNGRWLATSGAEAVVIWPFFGGGPMGKAPIELAGVPGSLCTRVAFHPQHDIVGAGFTDGTVLMFDVPSRRVLPVCAASTGAISALAFSPKGGFLAFATTSGRMEIVDLANPAKRTGATADGRSA